MPPKKKGKKKGAKKGKKKTGDGDEEAKNENEELKVSIPKFGWIKITVSTWRNILLLMAFNLMIMFRLQLKLCNAPTPEYNWFDIYMLTSQRVMMI